MGINSHIELGQALDKVELGDLYSSGLKWVSKLEEEQNPYVYLSLEQAKAFGADAVYFRFFENDGTPRPQIYIYSFEDLLTAKLKGPEIHHHL
jgi:hypothetical protein